MAALSTALAVLTAVVFGIIQVRHQNQRRREELVLDALHSVLVPDVLAAIHRVLDFPDGMGLDDLDKEPDEAKAAVATVDFNYEAFGWMVHRRMVDLHDFDDLMGGVARALWRKLSRIAAERRVRSGRDTEFEWLQWLAEQLERDPSPGKRAGAHVTHAGWRR
jgi:hypothetical protein